MVLQSLVITVGDINHCSPKLHYAYSCGARDTLLHILVVPVMPLGYHLDLILHSTSRNGNHAPWFIRAWVITVGDIGHYSPKNIMHILVVPEIHVPILLQLTVDRGCQVYMCDLSTHHLVISTPVYLCKNQPFFTVNIFWHIQTLCCTMDVQMVTFTCTSNVHQCHTPTPCTPEQDPHFIA